MTKKIILIFLFSLFTLSSITGCLMYLSDPPLPEALNIVPPSPDVPPEIAAFSGVWEGKWGANQSTVIVIEQIDSSMAEVIFSLGWGKQMHPENVYYRATAMVLPGPVIEWNIEKNPQNDCPCKITLEMEKGLKNITAFHTFDRTKVKLRAALTRRDSDEPWDPRKNNLTFSHLIFGSSSVAPQSQHPQNNRLFLRFCSIGPTKSNHKSEREEC